MVFARKHDAALTSLVKQLDKALADHQDEKLSAFVALMGDDREALVDTATKMGAKHKISRVAITVPVEYQDGPANYGISPDAELTVLIYRNLQLEATHAVAPGGLTKKKIAAILDDLSKVL